MTYFMQNGVQQNLAKMNIPNLYLSIKYTDLSELQIFLDGESTKNYFARIPGLRAVEYEKSFVT